MKIVKNINNNVSICIDNDGNELIAFGKGLGFRQPPYEITDLDAISRTFYDVDHRYFDLLNLISDEIFEIAAKIVDFARTKIDSPLNPNIVFTLADHIQFAIKRSEDNLHLPLSIFHDLRHFHPTEVDIGFFAIKIIHVQMKIRLSEEEALSIAMHFINAESGTSKKGFVSNEKIISDVVSIIEKTYDTKLDHFGFNYSRFASHMEYLLERGKEGKAISSQNMTMFQSLKSEFPKSFHCSKRINDYFVENLNWALSEEEVIYLILHINRLCSREDMLE